MGTLSTAPRPAAGDIATQRLLPRESPLPMAPADLEKGRVHDRVPAPVAAAMAWRRSLILLSTALLTAAGGYEMYRVLQVGGVTVLETMVLALFVVLLAWVAFSFASALAGFFCAADPWFGRLRARRGAACDRKPHRHAASHLQRRPTPGDGAVTCDHRILGNDRARKAVRLRKHVPSGKRVRSSPAVMTFSPSCPGAMLKPFAANSANSSEQSGGFSGR